jgi:hypothetical protein
MSPTKMLGTDGTKALATSGAAVVGPEFQADPVALRQMATGLIDVLPVMQHTNRRVRLPAPDRAHQQRRRGARALSSPSSR